MHAEDVHDPPTNGVYTLNQLRAAIPLLSQCVQEVVDVYSELPEEERSLGEFALRASDFLEDGLLLDVLLAVLRPHKVLAETMDSTFGLSISGSSQRLKTRIRVNCLRFKAISLEEEDYLQVLRYLQSRLKQGGVGVEDADEDATQPFAMIDRFPNPETGGLEQPNPIFAKIRKAGKPQLIKWCVALCLPTGTVPKLRAELESYFLFWTEDVLSEDAPAAPTAAPIAAPAAAPTAAPAAAPATSASVATAAAVVPAVPAGPAVSSGMERGGRKRP